MALDDQPFSVRHGFQDPSAEISVREDAPQGLRAAIVMLAYQAGWSPSDIRARICEVLLKRPDSQNWSEYPNISDEVDQLIDAASWHKIYDVAEKIYERLGHSFEGLSDAENFESGLNGYMCENGIGWQMQDGKIVTRGSEAFALASRSAAKVLIDVGKATAAKEIHEALSDLSRRPIADLTGAIAHSMAALECVAREISGTKDTLGQIIPKLKLSKPLDGALVKLWGFASEQGRHVIEGRNPGHEEAELIVTIAAAVSVYLVQTNASLQ